MGFAKSTFLSCAVTGLKLLNGFFLVKLVSIYVGPEGLAKTGQFISFISFLVLFAGGGINQGIIKYVSQYTEDTDRLTAFLRSGLYIMLTSTLVCFISMLLFADSISVLLFGTKTYSHIITLAACGQIFMAANNFLTAIINGYKEIAKLSLVNFFGVITGAIASGLLTVLYGFEGILVAYIFSQSFVCLFSFYFCWNLKGFNWSYVIPKFNKKESLLLIKFSVMALTSSVSMHLVQLLTRQQLAHKLSWQQVGYWEGVVKISDAYIILITTALSVYCLPTLSRTEDRSKLFDELATIFKIIVPLTVTFATLIFLLRDQLIVLLYSRDFMPMRELFFWQLVGDVIRVMGMVFAYFLLAKAFIRVFIFVEIVCSLTFMCLIYTLTNFLGLEGAIYAFTINSFIFLILSLGFSWGQFMRLPQLHSINLVSVPKQVS